MKRNRWQAFNGWRSIGDVKTPILYHVDRTRDGSTYTSRSVKATQHSVPVFTMQASFKIDEQDPFHHQYKMPDVPGPEGLLNTRELYQLVLDHPEVNGANKAKVRTILADTIPLEMRPVDPKGFLHQKVGEPKQYIWMRAIGKIGDNLKVHQCVVACLSDMTMLGVATQPGGRDYKTGYMTSLDHTVWFHNPFRGDEWMLYESECPQCGAGKALTLGRVWRQDGVLAVSLAQEGVVRSKI
ncbi:hypothetical protein ScPMuIL_001170 [Solemya velum]